MDQRQIDIYRKLSFAERFYQGCSISDTARKVVATEFTRKTHDYRLLKQIAWHYRERIANDE